jgi:hypothetical protein
MILNETDVTFLSESKLQYLRWNYVIEKAGLAPHEFKAAIAPYLQNNSNVVVISRNGVYDLYIVEDSAAATPIVLVAPAEEEAEEYRYYRGIKTKITKEKDQAPNPAVAANNPEIAADSGEAVTDSEEEYEYIYYRGAKTKIKKNKDQAPSFPVEVEVSYRGSKSTLKRNLLG